MGHYEAERKRRSSPGAIGPRTPNRTRKRRGGGLDRMSIQVTHMEKTRENPRIKNAGKAGNLTCDVGSDGLVIRNSDYGQGELDKLAGEILRAVLNKKRLLGIRR
jgi:hypothetical protein